VNSCDLHSKISHSDVTTGKILGENPDEAPSAKYLTILLKLVRLEKSKQK
jgi:hypothetical protein